MKPVFRSIFTFLSFVLLLSFSCMPHGLADEAAQPWPANGELYRSGSAAGEQASLKIVISNLSSGYASLVKLTTDEGELVSCLFAGNTAGSTQALRLSTSVPGGNYVLTYGTGTDWYGQKAAFGTAGTYSKLLLEDNQSVIPLDAGYTYTLYIDASPDSTGGSSEAIAYGSF